MPIALKISESTSCNENNLLTVQLVITNTSNDYITNVMLTRSDTDLSLLSQQIIRQRGSLSLDPSAKELAIGNLAPDESAYLEYQLPKNQTRQALTSHINVTYTTDNSSTVTTKPLETFLVK